jgi:hypothetical protein
MCVASPARSRRTLPFASSATNCQAFARFLERPDVLDDAGGTDIVHMPAACVTLAAGADAVRCISFSAGPALVRRLLPDADRQHRR